MKPLYFIGKISTSFVLWMGGIRILGRENIPKDKSLLVICNHVSMADPLALAMAFPYQLTFIAKEAFQKNWFTRWLLNGVGAVFLKKDESDLGAMRVAMKELKEGHAVGIFPEGHRSLDQRLCEFKSGAAYISYKSGVRVLPVALLNTGDFWRVWKRNIRVCIGEPLSAPDCDRPDKETLTAYSELYQGKVASLLADCHAAVKKDRKKMRVGPNAKKER